MTDTIWTFFVVLVTQVPPVGGLEVYTFSECAPTPNGAVCEKYHAQTYQECVTGQKRILNSVEAKQLGEFYAFECSAYEYSVKGWSALREETWYEGEYFPLKLVKVEGGAP